MPRRPSAKASRPPDKAKRPGRRYVSRWRWRFYLLIALLGPLACLALGIGYFYSVSTKLIDERIKGEQAGGVPRVFGRSLEIRREQALSDRQLIERLNDLGYVQRARVEREGDFAIGRNALAVMPRHGELAGRAVRIEFVQRVESAAPARVEAIEVRGRGPRSSVTLGAPLISGLTVGDREKRRKVPLAAIPERVRHAVLAIEDRRFYIHPGVDIIRTLAALVTNLRGDRPYLVGGSTLTQQLVKNFFLTPEKTIQRKLLEQFMALLLERRLSKERILELYLNEVYLGQRGSFAIHGVGEAARLFFGKDVANLTLAEAATIAGVIQSPSAYSPFRAADRARDRRNVVLTAMREAGFIGEDAAVRASREPLIVSPRGIESEAPFFVDLVAETLEEDYPGVTARPEPIDVYTTLDLHLQRLAQDAVRDGLQRIDRLKLAHPRGDRPEAVLIALDPRTGDILALVGGRSYSHSQYNRAASARRQPGSVFKPFVYLAAFEEALTAGQTDLTPASLVIDEPTLFSYERRVWQPANYGGEYDGPITLRRALALSRNVAAVKVAERTGYDRVAAFWQRIGAGTAPKPYPSIALGVFEATPLEIARAYTVFPNLGDVRALRSIVRVVRGDRDVTRGAAEARRVSRPDTTFLVTNMMRSVLDEGTGAAARATGFALDAAGKSGTTNDLRDAWFVGFTPSLLAVVWVGFDDNHPLRLSGTQAALPIWTAFMTRATAGLAGRAFDPPAGITFADIDRETGQRARPSCPRVFREAFRDGTEPREWCTRHLFSPS